MLKIETRYLRQVQEAATAAELCVLVQNAIELEHSTIPPYLTAMISLKPEKNREIWEVIHSVVIEEMLHMTIAANLMNALGGEPQINTPEFVPTYPGPLPMSVGDGLIVGLERFSRDQVKNVFMAIEEPEDPLEFPVAALTGAAVPEFATIGQFYGAIREKILELPDDELPGDPARQVVDPRLFPADELFAIRDKEQAVAAIDLIVEQGEGTEESPLDPDGGYAHYYRFEELYVGRRLVKDDAVPQGYSFSGPPFPFEKDDVWPLAANTKAAQLPAGSEQRRQADQFNFVYGKLLNGLHRSFNGDPGFLQSTLGLMYDVKLVGERLAAMDFPGRDGETVGPPFEYSDVNR
jgi:hypothetical protein